MLFEKKNTVNGKTGNSYNFQSVSYSPWTVPILVFRAITAGNGKGSCGLNVKTANAGGGRNHQVFGVRGPRGNKTIKNTVPLKHVKLWLWLLWLWLWLWFVVVDDVADSASAVSNILPDVWYANVPTFANLTKNDQTNGKMYIMHWWYSIEYESV